MESPLYAKISGPCKAAAKRKFKVQAQVDLVKWVKRKNNVYTK